MSFYPYAAYHLTQSGGKALCLLSAKLNDSGSEAFQFLSIDATDRAKVAEGTRFGYDDITQNRVAEDEERG